MIRTYDGSCHCGAVRFRLRSEPITTGVRCNCSMCIRKGTVMSSRYFTPSELELLAGEEHLEVYQFGDRDVNHYFCRRCGIQPIHDVVGRLGHYRVNLGCLDGLDPLELDISLIDGRSFPSAQ